MSSYTSKYFENGEQLDEALLAALNLNKTAENAVLHTPQTLTESQKVQARDNIGAVGFEGTPSKNIADITWVNGQFRDGVFVAMTTGLNNAAAEEYIPVAPQTTYTASCASVPNGSTALYIQQYDADKNWLGDRRQYGFTKSFTFTTVENTMYIRVNTYVDVVAYEATIPENFQIELGTVATGYVEPGSDFDGAGAVLYLKQSLTDAQKSQARENIGAAKDEGDLELIAEITLTEAVSEVVVTPEKLINHVAIAVYPPADISSSMYVYIYVEDGDFEPLEPGFGHSQIADVSALSTADTRFLCKADVLGGMLFAYWGVCPKEYQSTNAFKFLNKTFKTNGMSKFYIRSVVAGYELKAGSVIKVWGC